MHYSPLQKLLFACLLIPALLVISCANICRCAEEDCRPQAAISVLGECSSHGHHHGHSHHHAPLEAQEDESPAPHDCDHSAEPMVQVEPSPTPAFLPLVMVFVEYLNLYQLNDYLALESPPLVPPPPLLRSVLIEPYRPLLI